MSERHSMRSAICFGLALALWNPLTTRGADSDVPSIRDLGVHLVQANNHSPYAFVRAKFEPGELTDPWAVRFFDERGAEVPCFVWDSVTWQVAREGRADWGHRYALINHAAGNAPETLSARGEKLLWANEKLPDLGARLQAQDDAAGKNGESICAAMYLLRRSVPAMEKDRLTLRIYPRRQVEPKHRLIEAAKVGERIVVQQEGLKFQGLPDSLSVTWKEKEIFHCAGFNAGGQAGTVSHADPSRPFKVETLEGIVTKLIVTGQTAWRRDGAMDWQCSYWLFPEGGFVALEGFSLTRPAQYLGGEQKLSAFAAPDGIGAIVESHAPDWGKPWWLHQVGDRGYVATHLFFATPLTIGFGNNPFTVNAEGPGKEPRVEMDGGRMALRWSHEINDPAIMRLSSRQGVTIKNGHMAAADNPPAAAAPAWQPDSDWLYRQYMVGVGENAEAAETALRNTLGAAAGWIDRPVSEEQTAALLVSMMSNIGVGGQSAEIGLLKIVPAVLKDDRPAIDEALRDRMIDVAARTDQYIQAMRQNVADGGNPAAGSKLLPDGTRVEGWTGNPCYHAALMPCHVRVLEFFDQPFAREQSRKAILRYADFALDLLGGTPFDEERFRQNLESQWPSRVVPTIPLMLHAYSLKADEKYLRAARIIFGDLSRLAERNPHGYFPAWSFTPRADKYDTVYNPVSYDRGIASIWYEEAKDKIGPETASRFVAAQARWFVFSGQLLDTLEMDNVTAIRACNHGAHTNLRNQIGIYLYDDFDFYRGLVGDLVDWSAASDQVPQGVDRSGTGPYRELIVSDAGSPLVRWGLGIRPGGKWLESKVEPLAAKKGFRLQAWNRLPLARPTIKVIASDAGMPGDAPLLQAQLLAPAYRQPAEFEVTREADNLLLKISKPANIRLSVLSLCPDWPADVRPVFQLRQADGRERALTDGVVWEKGILQWQVASALFADGSPMTLTIARHGQGSR